ncbi:uncharacterized protein KGF55_004987 [Candida pseudojiufengensis]|uniref:uncharacterized protein n=1 Tax=Candida pseudojiufengensis TaxID=497109 RepID=UPI0022252BAC|nr:uncharacterized protein KGF55_004987 [Candida pseudojiufengensis]KAI5959755.1 hypothetical protein KGF55_004987 [Candida pseudojiufengensis]
MNELDDDKNANSESHNKKHRTSSSSLADNDRKMEENSIVLNPVVFQSNPINHVDINALNKTNTTSSQVSNNSSSTIKSKPLSKLFSRKKSSTNISDTNHLESNEFELESHDSNSMVNGSSQDWKKHRSMKHSIKKHTPTINPKSEFVNASLHNPENIKPRKTSISSPVSSFSNLFHKSYVNPSSNKLDRKQSGDQFHTNQSKTGLCLSSNNSNSSISNSQQAKLFKFTNPNYTTEEYDGVAEHRSLLDIHKKLSTPADSYIQHKLNKHVPSDLGLGIVTDMDNKLTDKEIGKAQKQLMQLLKVQFLPSKQGLFHQGLQYPSTGFALEDFSVGIKEHFKNLTNSGEPEKNENPKINKVRGKSNKFSVKHHRMSQQIKETDNPPSEFSVYKTEDVVQELLLMLNQGMRYMKDDMSKLMNLELSHKNLENKSGQELTQRWTLLARLWIYYDTKIRFQILQILSPLEIYLQSHHFDDNNQIDFSFPKFDELSLYSFYINIINPFLNERNYNSLKSKNVSPNLGHLVNEEIKFFTENPKITCVMMECFGKIRSMQYSALMKSENETQYHMHTMKMLISELMELGEK